MTTLLCFMTNTDEKLEPKFNPRNQIIHDIIRAGSMCAVDPGTSTLYYGQEQYKCPEHLLMSSMYGELLSIPEYYTKHQEHLAKQYPDAPVLCTIDTTSTPEKTPGMSRLAALGVKITRN